jgi:hypothetical protein
MKREVDNSYGIIPFYIPSEKIVEKSKGCYLYDSEADIKMGNGLKYYSGRIPACGVFLRRLSGIYKRKVTSTDLAVVMRGYSVCPDGRLNNVRAIWVARIAGDKIDEWHVYPDTEENRKFLEI